MSINGKAFSTTRDEVRAQNPGGHPPVVLSGKLKTNDGTYSVGTLLKYDTDGITLIPMVTAGAAVVGVLDETIDTATQTSGNYVRHGSVVASVLKVRDGSDNETDPSVTDLILLQANGIFPQ